MPKTVEFSLRNYVAAPAAPTVTPQGTPALKTWTYKIVAVDAEGNETEASAGGSTTTGAAALNNTDFNRITWTDPLGTDLIRIYRTVHGAASTPTTLGLIGEVAAGVETFDDTGIAADGSTANAVNATGYSDPVNALVLYDMTFQFGGTFSATLQLYASLDGITYLAVGDAKSAPAFVDLNLTYMFVKVRMTAYASGTPTAILAGRQPGDR